jgi:uncharacterized membrane protein YkvA (DUF1232 family)
MASQEEVDGASAKLIEEGAKRIDQKDLEKVVDKAEDIRKKFVPAGPLQRFAQDVRLLIAMVRAYLTGKYKLTPYWTIAAIGFTLLYVFNPFDLVPDVLPVIGSIDDATVFATCMMLIERDLKKFTQWKDTAES